ncbi:hypothetical protein Tco_1459310 [Tanacetum coccineum]
MSSSRKSPHDYLRRYRRAILEPWRQSHLLPPSPPVSPNRSPSNSPTITNSLSSPSPPQNPFQNQIVDELNELHHLSNLIDINLQRAIDATTQTPPSSPLILPATLEQVNFHSKFCHLIQSHLPSSIKCKRRTLVFAKKRSVVD